MTDNALVSSPDRRRWLIAFRGAVWYEFQIGRLYGGLMRPSYISRRNLRRLVRLGWDRTDSDD